MPVTVDVRTLPPLTVACLRRNAEGDAFGPGLGDAVAAARAAGLEAHGQALRPVRLAHDISPSGPLTRRFDIGVVVPSPDTATATATAIDCGPLEAVTVRGGTYAVALHRGPATGVNATYRWLLDRWLPDSGYTLARGPCVEIHLSNPDTTPDSDLLTEVRVPVYPRPV